MRLTKGICRAELPYFPCPHPYYSGEGIRRLDTVQKSRDMVVFTSKRVSEQSVFVDKVGV